MLVLPLIFCHCCLPQVTDHKGHLVYLSKLMPPPFAALHYKWMRVSAAEKNNARLCDTQCPVWLCDTGPCDTGSVTLALTHAWGMCIIQHDSTITRALPGACRIQVAYTAALQDAGPKPAMGSCRAGGTVPMLTAKGAQLPVRLTISSKEGPNDKPLHVVAVEKSSWEEGMDERRLSMRIDDKGVVEELVSDQRMRMHTVLAVYSPACSVCSCCHATSCPSSLSSPPSQRSCRPLSSLQEPCCTQKYRAECDGHGTALQVGSANPHLYGFKPANLVGRTLSHFVDALEPYASTLPELVTAMVTKAAEKPGLSWRVGIHPPWEPGCSGMSVTQVSSSRLCCRACSRASHGSGAHGIAASLSCMCG
jgi:hypothetical protein